MPPDPPAGTTGSFNITVDNVSINKFDLRDEMTNFSPKETHENMTFIC